MNNTQSSLKALAISAIAIISGTAMGQAKGQIGGQAGRQIAEQIECVTSPSAGEVAIIRQLEAQGLFQGSAIPGTVSFLPVVFHIVRHSDGTGGLPASRIDVGLADANAAYASLNMQFCKQGDTLFLDDDAFYTITSYAQLDQVRQKDAIAGAINVYLVEDLQLDGSQSCGYSSFSTSSTQGIVIRNGCFGLPSNPSTFPHELGHYFDLYHTHETAFGRECSNGSNCGSSGDLMCDTPADPGLSGLVDNWCFYTGNLVDPCGQSYFPDTTNFMSYSNKTCRNSFTNQQGIRMSMSLHNFRSNLIHANCAEIGRQWNMRGNFDFPVSYHHASVFDSVRGRTYFMGFGKLSEYDGLTTILRFDNAQPLMRYAMAATFDSTRGVTILQGGMSNDVNHTTPYTNETWEYNGTSWRRASVAGPGLRGYHAMAFDPSRNRTVLFGGTNSNGVLGDTWEWNGLTWTQKFPIVSPPAQNLHTMAYDPVLHEVLLVGGMDTWSFDGNNWTLRSQGTIGSRYGASMATDTYRNTVVIFGGLPNGSSNATATAEWNGTSWEIINPTGSMMMTPPNTWLHQFSYDSLRRTMVLTGGFNQNLQVWELGDSRPVANQPPTGGGDHGAGDNVSLHLNAGGSGQLFYQWRKNGLAIHDVMGHIQGTSAATMNITNAQGADSGSYSCTVTGSMGQTTSPAATLTVSGGSGCVADFNHDGVVDFFDYLDFVDAFSSGGPTADFNHDGVIDFFDYLDFVDAFSAGC